MSPKASAAWIVISAQIQLPALRLMTARQRAPCSRDQQLLGVLGAGRQTFVFPGQNVVEGEAERVAAALQRRRPPLALPTDRLQAHRQLVRGRWRWKRRTRGEVSGDGEEAPVDLVNERPRYPGRRPSRTRRP